MRHYFNPSAQPTPQLFTIHYSLFTGAAGRETRSLRCPSGDLLGDDYQPTVGAGIFAGGKAQKLVAILSVNAGVVQRKGFALGDKIGKFFF